MSAIAVHLMRHGAPELAGRLLGRTDCAATEDGIAACVAAAEGLAVAAIVASDLRRSVACAQAIGRAHGLPVRVDARWRELDFGDWDGLSAERIEPGALARFYDDPEAHAPPGGERWSALVARTKAALDAVRTPTLVLTHGGPMRAVLADSCGIGLRGSWAFDLPYAALLSLRRWPGAPPTVQITGLRCAG
ncbi:histidine phosphatase family protein [Sphingomonas sp. S2-65]|uniref:histidine phosphatase family protein n=1 Tax=Sphingomonas sp. S2-65 TaxID=2903960 RepID=UPI001F380E61|nr:histidine phosphatase family protein [Sphingomonas sp. S2-65]UYY59212.1 histidine phosphatase family protein [Sphingomonas sp. S2-65]